jgi:hypothetical protein
VAPLIPRGPAAFASTALAVVVFGIATGNLGGTVVVYLRAGIGIVLSAVPGHDPETLGTFEAVEVARELTTLVMITAVAGGGLVIASLVVGTDRAVAGNTSVWSGWPLLWDGMAVRATASALGAFRITPTWRGGGLGNGSGRRHQAGSPD